MIGGERSRKAAAIIRNRWSASDAKSADEMETAAPRLTAMRSDGVVPSEPRTVSGDYIQLETTDSSIAAKYDMVEESEYWPDDEDAEGGGQSAMD